MSRAGRRVGGNVGNTAKEYMFYFGVNENILNKIVMESFTIV